MSNKSALFNSSGFLLINKPSGPTSHDVIDQLRKITGLKKIGHAGTLDPFASGVLVVGIGREATKKLGQLAKLDKEYIATLRLGGESDTYDRTGKIAMNKVMEQPGPEKIKRALESFIGVQKQVPPMFSAKKINGKKLYQYARAGMVVARAAREINIYRLKLLSFAWPKFNASVSCSSGTYIRALAEDIGQSLGCGAYLEELERTAVGQYELKQAIVLNKLNKENWPDHIIRDTY